jgi:hypothetical protein
MAGKIQDFNKADQEWLRQIQDFKKEGGTQHFALKLMVNGVVSSLQVAAPESQFSLSYACVTF